MSELPEAIPAATLVLMREGGGGAPELLVTERTGQMAFAAGALVFPGGRIDEDDHRTARGLDLPDAAARVAAILGAASARSGASKAALRRSSASIRPPGKTSAPAANAMPPVRSVTSSSGGPPPRSRISTSVAAGIGAGSADIAPC